MLKHKSAIKRHRQSAIRELRNHAVKSRVRTLVKRVRIAVEQKNVEAATEQLARAVRALDQGVSKGVFHRNAASRRISRLTAQVGRLGK